MHLRAKYTNLSECRDPNMLNICTSKRRAEIRQKVGAMRDQNDRVVKLGNYDILLPGVLQIAWTLNHRVRTEEKGA